MQITEEEKEKLIPEMNSKALAAHVVAYKTIGLYKSFAIKCLQELVVRKSKGDDFDYESFINEEIAKIPKPGSVDHNSIFSAFKNASKNFMGSK
jgi:hypothetical protein